MSTAIPTLHLDAVLQNHGQDMRGKVVAITGTTSGTGFICAREVARKGATVLLLNRASVRADESLQQLQAAVPGGKFEAVECDLQDFASVRAAIAAIQSRYQVLDVLVNNAAVMALKDQATKDGYDIQMQTNVLSHFLLTKDLFPLLKNSPQARIVNHSSGARLGGPLKMEYFEQRGGQLGGDGDPLVEGFRGPRWERYHQTKLANATFTYGLQQKLEAAEITHVLPLLAHPGLSRTQLQVTTAIDGGMDIESDFMKLAQSAEDGATGIIRACMDPHAKAGHFFGPAAGWTGYPDLLPPEALLLDAENIRINWEGCEAAVGAFRV